MLSCESCGGKLSFPLTPTLLPPQALQAAERLSTQLQAAHKLGCLWRTSCCDANLAQIPNFTAAAAVADFDDRYDLLSSLTALPKTIDALDGLIEPDRTALSTFLASGPQQGRHMQQQTGAGSQQQSGGGGGSGVQAGPFGSQGAAAFSRPNSASPAPAAMPVSASRPSSPSLSRSVSEAVDLTKSIAGGPLPGVTPARTPGPFGAAAGSLFGPSVPLQHAPFGSGSGASCPAFGMAALRSPPPARSPASPAPSPTQQSAELVAKRKRADSQDVLGPAASSGDSSKRAKTKDLPAPRSDTAMQQHSAVIGLPDPTSAASQPVAVVDEAQQPASQPRYKEMDAINAHRPFCPWAYGQCSTDGDSRPGWLRCLAALMPPQQDTSIEDWDMRSKFSRINAALWGAR
ncbi:hypothetical protein WJX72_009906 [[Myrmecia] bisecta]|uniref:C3HC-type domain-containing protein n=1 Tax=[Myrmecia] bisecta TaxID=41462 RepID=A0AAW1QG18_9CHLO